MSIPRNENAGKKNPSNRATKFAAAHGMTEGQKRKINREVGPKKNFIAVADRERQIRKSVPKVRGKVWKKLSRSTVTFSLKNCHRAYHPHGRCNIKLRLSQAVNPHTDYHIG